MAASVFSPPLSKPFYYMKKGFLPVLLLFLLVNSLTYLLKDRLLSAGVDTWVLLGGNIVLFVITLISITLNRAALQQNNTQRFVRNVYGGFMLKFFLVIIAILLYVVLAKPVNKPALFACMGLYLLYTFLATRSVLHPNKPTTDGNRESRV